MTFIHHKNGNKERVCLKTGETILITQESDGVINVNHKTINVESKYDNSRYDKPYESR